jgi:hypothetical protein
MCRNTTTTLAGLGLLVLLGSVAAAQPPMGPSLQPSPGPSVSPYLNLLNPGGSIGSNYYNLYRPQRDFERFQREATQAARQFSSQIGAQRAQLDEFERRRSQLSPSGTAATFMTHQRFFGTRGR